MKLYFQDGDEMCYGLGYHRKFMEINGIRELVLTEGRPTKAEGFFYCRHYFSVSEKGHCGKGCDGYGPRNGKNGACRSLGSLYERMEKKITIKNNYE